MGFWDFVQGFRRTRLPARRPPASTVERRSGGACSRPNRSAAIDAPCGGLCGDFVRCAFPHTP